MCVRLSPGNLINTTETDFTQRDAKAAEGTTEGEIRLDRETGFKIVPHWLAQPYFRPPSLRNKNERPKFLLHC